MTLDVVADSKAAAERKAVSSGMVVSHAQQVVDPGTDQENFTHQAKPAKRGGTSWFWLFILAMITSTLLRYFWRKISGMLS